MHSAGGQPRWPGSAVSTVSAAGPAAEAAGSAAVVAEVAPAVDCAVAGQPGAETFWPWLAGGCLALAAAVVAGEKLRQLVVAAAAAAAGTWMTWGPRK